MRRCPDSTEGMGRMKGILPSTGGQAARRALALLALTACLPALATTHTYDCPAYVTATSASAGETPAPWKAYSQPTRLKLVAAGLSDGHPAELALLKPEEIKRQGSSSRVKWKLEGAYPGGVWLSCDYEGRTYSLTRELPSGISECVLDYNEAKAGKEISSIVCK